MADISTGNTPAGTYSGSQPVREKMETVKQDIKSAAGDLRNKVSDVGRDVRDLASTSVAAAREQLDPVEDYIRQYPLRAMLIAAGAGLVLGMIFKSR